jgi:hypothetical protein
VAQDGSLRRYELDHPEQIDPLVRDFVERNIKSWSFEVGSLPVGISPTATIRNSMSVLVVARPVEGNTYSLRLAGSNFNAAEPEPGTQLGYANIKPPAYPQAAVAAGVKGKVFLMVKVGRNGAVEDAIAEQVNLGVVARNEKEMERWRRPHWVRSSDGLLPIRPAASRRTSPLSLRACRSSTSCGQKRSPSTANGHRTFRVRVRPIPGSRLMTIPALRPMHWLPTVASTPMMVCV